MAALDGGPVTETGDAVGIDRYGAALRDAERELARDPGSARGLALRALALAGMHRDTEAVAEADAAAAQEPLAAWPQVVRSTILREAGRAMEALAAAEEAVRLSPEDGRAHDARALALAARGRTHEALAAADRAAELAPDDAPILRHLADLLLDADPRAAERHYRAALDLEPGSAAAHAGLSRALERQGRAGASDAEREAAVAIDDPALAETRHRAKQTLVAILQASAWAFGLVLALGWLPSVVARTWPAAAGAVTLAAWTGAALCPVALLAWTWRRVRRLSSELPRATELGEALREVAPPR